MSNTKLIITQSRTSYKIGVDEIKGLKETMIKLMEPVRDALKQHIYWSDVDLNSSEYVSRDGFIPHSDNCGGIEILEIIPNCENGDFGYLEFGECDGEDCDHESGCAAEDEGHLDAKLRIWFKFEGINTAGDMEFYLVVSGGNADAPYFREKYSPVVYESSFKAKTLAGLKAVGTREIKKLLKLIK